jgi:hypothetical protein
MNELLYYFYFFQNNVVIITVYNTYNLISIIFYNDYCPVGVSHRAPSINEALRPTLPNG